MLASIQHILEVANSYVWGWPTIALLIFGGVYLTVLLGGLQFRRLGYAMRLALNPPKHTKAEDKHGSISNFQALSTALAATVGTGNIAGVATAITIGGPGALFWMWVTGLLGMATKYSEALLAVHYRRPATDDDAPKGGTTGGPMYYLKQGVGGRFGLILGWLYALFLVVGTLGGGGMVQGNSLADALLSTFNISPLYTGLFLAGSVALVLLGGVKRVGKVAEMLVPSMIVLYVCTGIAILILQADRIPGVFALIFSDAFTGTSAVGGFAGSSVAMAMRMGFARGIFSNESGLGTSAIAAAAAKTKHPVEQALVSMTQTFIDTLVVCTFTGVILLLSGLWTVDGLAGASLTSAAFGTGLNHATFSWLGGQEIGQMVVSIALFFFVYTTILGWGYYALQCAEYLFGRIVQLPFKIFFIGIVFLGAYILELASDTPQAVHFVWSIAELTIALLIFPNLIGLLWMAPKIYALTADYFRVDSGQQKEYQVKPFANE